MTSQVSVWREARRSLVIIVLVALVLGSCLVLFVYTLPHLQVRQADDVSLRQFPPASVKQLIQQRDVLLAYAAAYPGRVLLAYCFLYLTMQTFAIPGTLSLSLLSGAVYGSLKGLLLVSVVSTLGSTSCYLLSLNLGKALAHAVWPKKLAKFGAEVKKRKDRMLNYIIFLRVTPILPNTFINIASPVVDVPIFEFVAAGDWFDDAGTLIGCLPNNFVAVNAGSRLSELTSLRDFYDFRIMCLGLAVGCVALLPIYFEHRQQQAVLCSKTS